VVNINGLNSNGDYVGYCEGSDSNVAGFTHIGGVDQSFAVFGLQTYPTGINDSGTIVGFFNDASGFEHGFISTAGTATQFDFPGSPRTAIRGVNNRGSLTGVTFNSSSQWTSFYAFAN
jgi:probable HAF family extracellular repeat protein